MPVGALLHRWAGFRSRHHLPVSGGLLLLAPVDDVLVESLYHDLTNQGADTDTLALRVALYFSVTENKERESNGGK